MNEPKKGRPATDRGAYNPNPARQLGRVSDEDWKTLKAAAEKRGETFTAWALAVLLRAAKRELKKEADIGEAVSEWMANDKTMQEFFHGKLGQ